MFRCEQLPNERRFVRLFMFSQAQPPTHGKLGPMSRKKVVVANAELLNPREARIAQQDAPSVVACACSTKARIDTQAYSPTWGVLCAGGKGTPSARIAFQHRRELHEGSAC